MGEFIGYTVKLLLGEGLVRKVLFGLVVPSCDDAPPELIEKLLTLTLVCKHLRCVLKAVEELGNALGSALHSEL